MAGSLRTSLCAAVLALAAAGTASATPANFSANFGDAMVLQREPSAASVYGFAGAGASGVTLPAKVTVSMAGTAAGGSPPFTATADVAADFTWKASAAAAAQRPGEPQPVCSVLRRARITAQS